MIPHFYSIAIDPFSDYIGRSCFQWVRVVCSCGPVLSTVHVNRAICLMVTAPNCLGLCVYLLFAVFACLGFLSPPNRGALMTAVLVGWYLVHV